MYNEHFGFKEAPFSIAPDPRYLYMSEQHREALAHLVYGFNGDGGFVLLTGEIGTGKTTVCRCLLEQIPENSAIAFILNPKLTVDELLASICDEFSIAYPSGNRSIKVFVDLLNQFLLDAYAAGRKAVLIIDEAQNLSSDVLEQLRLLTNLETSQQKLLQIILLGQPELRDKLSRPELHQLSQRIVARYHLSSLSKRDVNAYVAHRLAVAGSRSTIFPDSTINILYSLTGGVPRLINTICDRALLGAYTQDKTKVTRSILRKASREVFGGEQKRGYFRKAAAWAPLVSVFIVFGAVLATSYYNNLNSDKNTPPVVDAELSSASIDTVSVNNDIAESSPDPVEVVLPEPDTTFEPDILRVEQSRDMGYKALFAQWGMTYDPEENGPACEYAEEKGLRCLHSNGILLSLILLNRPALLEMKDNDARTYFGVISSLHDDMATLTVNEESARTPRKDIAAHWTGNYTVLWQPPPDYQSSVKEGYEGPLVQWLDEKLAIIHNRPMYGEGELIYNSKLVREVIKFQVTEGLVPDGIVGQRTLIHINSLTERNTPLLREQQKKGT